MSQRVLPFDKPTWDYSLWNEVQPRAASITDEQVHYLSSRDRGGSKESNFWQSDGRRRSRDDPTKVVDFIGLSTAFDTWFTRVELGSDGLLEEFQRASERFEGTSILKGFDEEWLDINWTALGRAVGAAVANEGRRQNWWQHSGSDARMSNTFWMDFEKESRSEGGYRKVDSDDWDDLVVRFREHEFDPGAEIVRSVSHRPSAPIFEGGSDYGPTYAMNPLVSLHRDRMRERFRGSENAEEYANFHGELTFKVLRDAMDALKSRNEMKFGLIIHGICSHHIMRTRLMQQKIGLHLITNLAVRQMTRKVGAINVPDLARQLDTAFTFGKVLEILYKSGLIKWRTVDEDVVEAAIQAMKKKS